MTKIGITGHQNLPPYSLDTVRSMIDRVLNEFDKPVTGISSLAVGADQLFAESVLQHQGQLTALIPCQGYEATFEAEADLNRYHGLLHKASSVIELDYSEPSEVAFLEAGHELVRMSDLLIAVWDGKSGGKGGTADIVAFAQSEGKPIRVLWPKNLKRE
ncbi:MAG: hypothetical protein KF886_10225 [Candidatus Hydrogenedentes bacterium]|nr:hypothetical protein [Candidatus Hydrogenedentota bacterium]